MARRQINKPSQMKRTVRIKTPKSVNLVSLPKVSVRRISLDPTLGEEEAFQCNIDFCIDLPNSGNSMPDSFFKNFHILVVQCTSQAQSDKLRGLTAEVLAKAVYDNSKINFSGYRTFSVDQKQLRNLKNPAVSEKAELCFSLEENGPFKVHKKNVNHLSYIFVPYLENVSKKTVADFGTPTIEVVYKHGQKNSMGFALVEKGTGLPHKGHATLAKPPGALSKPKKKSQAPAVSTPRGTIPVSTPPLYGLKTNSKGMPTGAIKELEVVEIPNITIQDNRIWSELKIDNSSFIAQVSSTISDTVAPTAYDPVKAASAISDDKKVYFSDLTFSKSDDANQSNKIMLSLNFKKMATDAALYPWLMQNSDRAQEIVKLTKIKSLKIYRRCTQCSETSTPLGMATHKGTEPTEEKVHIVARSSDDGGYLKTKAITTSSNNQAASVVLAGSIAEINLVSDSDEIRSFAITDSRVNLMGGKHQYGIEVEVEEATKLYMKAKLAILTTAITVIKRYASIAQSRDPKTREHYFNAKHRKFISTFESALRPPIDRANLLKSIVAYLNTLSDLTSDIVDINIVAPQLFNSIAPENGTIENIMRLEAEMAALARKIDDMLVGKERDTVSKGEVQSMRHKAPDAGQKIYRTWFDDLYASSADIKNGGKIGYKFLPIDETAPGATSPGPPVLAQKAYQQITQEQHNKIFKVEGSISIMEGVQADISSTKPTYLSPVSVRTQETEIQYNPPSIPSRRSLSHNVDKYSEVITDALKHNTGIGIENKSTHPAIRALHIKKKDPALNLINNLVDLFSDKGCTVEGISSFSSQHCEEDSSVFSKRSSAPTMNVVDKKKRAPKDKGILDKESISGAENMSLKPKKILATIVGSLLKKNNSSWRQRGVKNSNLNLKAEQSTLKSMPIEKINELPNQINALMAIASGAANEKSLNVDTAKLNPVDKDNNDFYHENFANLRQVNMLVGYEKVNGESQMKNPIYKKLKQEDLNSLPAGQMAFCKTTQYENVEVGVERIRELELPVYNEAFVIKSDNSSLTNASPHSSTVSKKAKERSEIKNPEQVIKIKMDPTAIYTDNNFVGTNPDNSAPKINRRTPRPKRGNPPKRRQTAVSPTTPAAQPQTPMSTGPGPMGGGSQGGY